MQVFVSKEGLHFSAFHINSVLNWCIFIIQHYLLTPTTSGTIAAILSLFLQQSGF